MEIKPGICRHFKGMEYRVIGAGKHSETLEPMVVYEALYNNPESKLWVRPLAMFVGEIERDGRHQPRFTFIRES